MPRKSVKPSVKSYSTEIRQLSRREFLQLGAYGLLSALLPRRKQVGDTNAPEFGRVMDDAVLVYSEPSFNSTTDQVFERDDVLSILEVVLGDGLPYNQSWFRVNEGYIHSSLLQPVAQVTNQPLKKIGPWNLLTELTVPFSDAYVRPSIYGRIAYRYYFGSTHWIDHVTKDSAGRAWYRVVDDKDRGAHYYVLAEHLRVIPSDELTSLSPNVPENRKRIEVRVAEQMLIAYEDQQPVFITQCSTGDQSSNPNWHTPEGGYLTFYKRASRHMAAGNLAYGDYDLPGVPWVCYLTIYGIAIHGTYWHNDFGRPRSHGCVNLLPDAAKWVYRWTMPEVPAHFQLKYKPGHGTRVDILYT
jgi:hypothetical protein